MREGVRLVPLLAGLGDQVVDTHVLGGAGVVAVRQVLGGSVRLGGRGLGPHARVGGVRRLGGLPVERGLRLIRAGRRRGVRGAVVERLGHRVLGGEVLGPVRVLGVGVLEVHVRGGLRRHLAVLGRRALGTARVARALTAVTVVRRVHGYPTSSFTGPTGHDIAQRSTLSPVPDGSALSGAVFGVGSLGCSGASARTAASDSS